VFLSKNLDQNMPKNVFFLEKTVKIAKAAPPQTPGYCSNIY